MASTREKLEEKIRAVVSKPSEASRWEQVTSILKEWNISKEVNGINFPSLNQLVPLAAEADQYNLVFMLISLYGCNVNQPDKDGFTALYHSIICEKGNETKNLLKLGATDLNVRSNAARSLIKPNNETNLAEGIRERRASFPSFYSKPKRLIKPSVVANPPSNLIRSQSQQ